MKYVYASKTAHVEKIVGKLGLDALKIIDGTEKIDEDYVIFTYTCDKGKTPKPVLAFLENNPGVKAVVGSGSTAKSHIETFNFGAENIGREYDIPVLAKLPIDPQLAKLCDQGTIELFEGEWLTEAAEKIVSLEK